jgi:hypothetical protein
MGVFLPGGFRSGAADVIKFKFEFEVFSAFD